MLKITYISAGCREIVRISGCGPNCNRELHFPRLLLDWSCITLLVSGHSGIIANLRRRFGEEPVVARNRLLLAAVECKFAVIFLLSPVHGLGHRWSGMLVLVKGHCYIVPC